MTREKVRHAWLRALGAADMPDRIELSDGTYTRLRTYKHDFFAATGLYEGPSGRVILKIGRVARLLGLPMRWLGRWLSRRERALCQAVHDLPGIPRCIGTYGDTGFVRQYVEGHPLQREEWVRDDFFPRLERLLGEMHRRGIAYVDLEKRENILVSTDGAPCLIDFQISWRWCASGNGRRQGLTRLIPPALGEFVLARLQDGDRYHLLKHRRRHRPDGMTLEEHRASYRHGSFLALHRYVSRPLTLARRAMLKRLTGRSRSLKQDGPEFM